MKLVGQVYLQILNYNFKIIYFGFFLNFYLCVTMYNPDEKDVDLLREYDPLLYSISGKSAIDAGQYSTIMFQRAAMQRKYNKS